MHTTYFPLRHYTILSCSLSPPKDHLPQLFRIAGPLSKGAHALPLRACALPILFMAVVSPPPLLLLYLYLYLYLLIIVTVTGGAAADSSSDSAALLKFKSSIKGAAAGNDDAFSSWSESNPPCSGDASNWAHVRCSQGSVQSITLENLALAGHLDVDSLAGVSSLRTFSLEQNSFDGPLPSINKLHSLKSVFLSDNKFSGEIGDDVFKGMQSLKKLHLARNGFSGKIPASLVQLPKLMELRLEGNKFSGQIPDFQQKQLSIVDVSHNDLEGPIPASLAKMNSSFFSDNKGLCGAPLPECSAAASTAAADTKNSNNNGGTTNITIVVGVVVGVVVLVAAVIILVFCLRKRDDSSLRAIEAAPTPSNLQRKASFKEETTSRHGSSPAHSSCGRRGEAMKLSFLREESHKFDLQDLLKASAEILGSGCFGSSYKAALPTAGMVMVVKRFRQMNNVGKDEFQEHMRRLGRLTHPNLLPLVAYYYRKEEKLLVTEFVPRSSLALHLHSSGRIHPVLDWPSRLKIIKGVTRALVYLYNELPSLIAPHGHLKSSNVLLNDSNEPLLSDYGLIPVINQESAQDLMVAYKSPEYLQSTRVTKKTDVWSLGVLILEILTGKLPPNFLRKAPSAAATDQDQDLANWVASVGPTPEVFDKEMKPPIGDCTGEMVKMLKIGMACCDADFEKRLDVKEAAEMIEEVREKDCGGGGDDQAAAGFFSSHASGDDVQSVRGQQFGGEEGSGTK